MYLHEGYFYTFGGRNVYVYAPNPVEWVDSFGLMEIRKHNFPPTG